MPKTINAIYEDGVFKPLEKVNFKEHKTIKIILEMETEPPQPGKSALEGIIDIAEDCADSDLSVHHDKYLYGDLSK